MSAPKTVTLAPFEPAHARLFAAWLDRPHVARWYPQASAQVEWALDPLPGGAQAIVVLGAQPIGYLRWRTVSRETLDELGLVDLPAGAVDVDILIGEPDCVGRGFGPRALARLIEGLRRDPSVPLVALSPSIDNVAAKRAYAKAGFRTIREYDAPGFGRCALMAMRLDRSAVTPSSTRSNS